MRMSPMAVLGSILAALAWPASSLAQTVIDDPDHFPCAQFSKTPDGAWQLTGSVLMRFRPVYALLSDLKIERPGQIVFAAHLDLYVFIDAKCGAEKK